MLRPLDAPGTNPVKSAARVMDVLEFLASRVRPVRTMMIAKQCDLPKSSAYHLLNCMRERNFVIYYPEQRAWGLGPSASDIGGAYLRSEPLAWLGRPALRQLADESGLTAHLAVLHSADVLYIVKETPSQAPAAHLVSRVGLRLPAHLTAVGRAILMWMPRAQLHALLPLTTPLPRRTRKGPQLVSQLERELAAARELGYSLESGLTTPGVACLAATVFSHDGQPLAGLGVTFLADERSGRTGEIAEQVVGAASSLSASLGSRPRLRVASGA